MMDDKKRMQHILSISQQSVTEFVRYLKKKLEFSLLKEDLKTAESAEAMLRRLEDRPGKYTIAHVEEGDELEFRRLLEEQNVENFYVNASFMENYNGSWIIPTDQYQILVGKGLFKNIQQEREIMVDEDRLDSRLAESNLMTYIRFQEQEIRSIGDSDALESLLNLRAEILQLDNPLTVRAIKEKNMELEGYLTELNCPAVQILHPYMDRYYGCHVIPKAMYPELLEKGLIQPSPEMERGREEEEEEREERNPEGVLEEGFEENVPEKETDLDEEEITEEDTEEEPPKQKDVKQEKGQPTSEPVPESEIAVLPEPEAGMEPEIESYPEEASEAVAEAGHETPKEDSPVWEEPGLGISETTIEGPETAHHSEPETSSYKYELGSVPASEAEITESEIPSENHQADSWSYPEEQHPSPTEIMPESETEVKEAENRNLAEPVSPVYPEEWGYHNYETSPGYVEAAPKPVFTEEKPQPEASGYGETVSHEPERFASSHLPEQEIREPEQEIPATPEAAHGSYEPGIEETGIASETRSQTSGAWPEASQKAEWASYDPKAVSAPQPVQEPERKTLEPEGFRTSEPNTQIYQPEAKKELFDGQAYVQTPQEPEQTSFASFAKENRTEHQPDIPQEFTSKTGRKDSAPFAYQQDSQPQDIFDPILKGEDPGAKRQENVFKTADSGRREGNPFMGSEGVEGLKESFVATGSSIKPAAQTGAKEPLLTGIIGKGGVLESGSSQKEGKSSTEDRKDIPFKVNTKKERDLVVASDEIKRAVFIGHHDTFEKTVFRAAFSPMDETELAQSTRVLQNEQFVSTLRAANAMAVSSLVTRDSEALMRQLSGEQMAVLEKLITGNNCGKFDLSNPALYQESMESMHNYLTRIGIMEKRSVTSGGALLYSLDENGKVYRGNFFDRKIEKKHIKLEKGIEKTKRKQGKLSSGVAAEAAAKKAGKKMVSAKNRERALEMLQTDLGRIGRSKSEAEALLRIFYKNNKNFASTARIMAVAKKGRQRITTLNPFENALTAKGIKEDEYSRYIYRAKTVKETSQAAFQVGSMVARNMHNKNMANIARALNEADKRLAEGALDPLTKSKLMERREVLRRKQAKGLERGRKWEKRSQKLKKAEETLIKKPQEALKKPLKSMGNGIKKGANHIPGVRRIANFKWSAYMQNHRRLSRVISAPFRAYSKATEVVVSKFLLPLLAVVGQVLIVMIGIALICGVVLAISVTVSSMFTGEPGTNDAVTSEEIAQTTMGLVYNELQLQESTWVRNLTKSAESTTININDIRYTKIDEGSGEIDENYRNVDAATYIRDILGLEYDSATNRVKVPAPWLGAPEEASYTADGTITGGVELRYIGTGGYPGYTSNIMEIIAMASVANQESILTEYNEDYLSDASDAGVIGKLHGFLNSCLKGLKFFTNTVSEFAEKIVTAMPGGAEFLTRNESKTRAKAYYSYAKPLFNASHQTAYGLTFSFLPTDRTLGMDGAMDMNQFDPDLWMGEGSAGLEEAVDAEVPRQVWAFLKEHGFSDIHAAGVMGNFYQESRFNVNAVQFPGQRKGGIGLGQWTGLTANNNRRLKLENYALAMTGSREGWRNNIDLQLTYMMVGDEPQTVQRYLAQNFTSPGEAATWWGLKWERFDVSDGSLPKTRIPAANKYYSLYAGKDLSGGSDTGNGDETGGGTEGDASGGTVENETKKYYSHTPNIDDDGNATEPYRRNMEYQDSVTIDGAKSLKVELWYSTEKSHDWLNIRSEEQGPLSNWNNGNAQYSGGNEETKPEDNSENHVTLTIDGDTVYFAFKSDSSVQKYGYYAIVTADKMEADTGWLDDQIEFTNQIPSILVNANVCTGHNGHGCQSYSHFGYGDNSKKYLEYNGKRIDTVYPAALDPAVSNGEVACSAPSGTATEFFKAIDHNQDCWEGELIRTKTSGGRGYRTRGQSEFFDDQTSYGYRVTSENPSQFTVVITVDEDSDTDEFGDTEWEHTDETWIFRHKCNQEHTGYYCGGHMRLIIYGVIYHMTTEQRANNHEAYEEKTAANEYLKDYAAPFFQNEENMAKKDLINKANDLFDLDTAIYHVKGSVSKEFTGWNYDHIDIAAAKLEPDWNELYGINASWTINGINAGGAASATMVNGAQVKEIMEKIQSQFPHDGTDRVRYNAIQTAFQYVGKIGYNQKYHGAELRPGSYNDCSGFVSRVYWDVLRQIYNTDSFKSLAIRYGAYRNFTDGQCKPGDIMLHGMESSTRKDNHALLYVGVVDGEPMVIDCSTSGGIGNVFYRSRGSAYYNSATYIDMEVLIKGYLMEHPEMEGDFELDPSDEDDGNNSNGTGGGSSKPGSGTNNSGTKPDKPNPDPGSSDGGETNKPSGGGNSGETEPEPETDPDIDDMTDWEGTGNGDSGNKDPNPDPDIDWDTDWDGTGGGNSGGTDPDTGSDPDDMTDC